MLQTYSSKRRYLDSWLNSNLFSTKNFQNQTIFDRFRNFDWFYLNFHFFGDDFTQPSILYFYKKKNPVLDPLVVQHLDSRL